MNVLRPVARRAIRPHLSTRYQCLRRHESSATSAAESTASATAAPPPPPPSRSFFRRYRSTIVWSTLSIGMGFAVGYLAIHTISPPPMPQPGTHGDNILMADLNKRIDDEFRVKVLRGKCLAVPKMLKGEEGGWAEIIPATTASALEGTPVLPFHDRLVDVLQGAKGLGVERVFWDRGNQKLVAIVWFGGALSGWPGVTHGGLLATAMTEKIALADSLAAGGDRAVNSAVKPQRLPGTGNHTTLSAPAAIPQEPAQLSIDYLKPTYANNFHVIRVQPSWASGEDVRLEIPNHEYLATLETMDGKVCVKAAAKFAPRSELERVEDRLKEAVGWTYQDFKHWMWPSRQKQSQIH